MTLQELINKLNELKSADFNSSNDNKNADKQIYYFAEDEYQTFDVKIENVEIEDNKIFLS